MSTEETTREAASEESGASSRDLSSDGEKKTATAARPRLSLGHSLGLVLALVALMIIGIITGGERFVSVDNLMVILRQAAVIGVISIGVTFVITSGASTFP